MADIIRLDGKKGQVLGEYRVVPRPTRGNIAAPEDYAVVALEDGTKVFLETFGLRKAQRDAGERQRFDRRTVRVVGTVYRRMHTVGQGPLAPSVCNISSIEEVDLGKERTESP
jgi:hypothetical protein